MLSAISLPRFKILAYIVPETEMVRPNRRVKMSDRNLTTGKKISLFLFRVRRQNRRAGRGPSHGRHTQAGTLRIAGIACGLGETTGSLRRAA